MTHVWFFLWFSYGFPMVFLWFSYGFPMVFLWFSQENIENFMALTPLTPSLTPLSPEVFHHVPRYARTDLDGCRGYPGGRDASCTVNSSVCDRLIYNDYIMIIF